MKHYKLELEDDGEIDLAFDNHGSIWLMQALTTAGQAWVDEHISEEAMWFGGAIVGEPRYVEAIVIGAQDVGLVVV